MDEAGDSESNQSSSPGKLSPPSDKLLKTGEDNDGEVSQKSFKKARFVWQIKGNYHLKNTSSESEMKDDPECSGSEASSLAPPSSPCISDSSSVSNSQKGIGPAIPVCDHHPPTSSSDTTRTRTKNDPYPSLQPIRIDATSISCVVCDTFNENIRKASLSTDGEQSSETIPLPTSHPDGNVRKWQTRQIAQAFMDNAINSVLEELGFTPLSESAPDDDTADDFAWIYYPSGTINDGRSHEDEENDEGIENEGILSAIQKHGLQRHRLEARHHSFIRSSSTSCSPSPPRTWEAPDQLVHSPVDHEEDVPLSSPESLSVGSDIETAGPTFSPADIEADETDSSSGSDVDVDSSNDYSSCRCAYLCPSKQSEDGHTGLLCSNVLTSACSRSSSSSSDHEEESGVQCGRDLESAPSNLTTKFCSKSVDQEDDSCKKRHGNTFSAMSKRRCVELMDDESKSNSTSSSQTRSLVLDNGLMSVASDNTGINSPTFGHFEFMDAAVAAAIQIKGLSALACQDI